VDVNLRHETQRKVTVVNSTHPPSCTGSETHRRRFVVSCPACIDESRRLAAGGPRTPEACSLCSGFGRVPRIVAERYISQHGLAA